MLDLIRHEPRARRLLLAHAQSALGSGAGSVALLVVTWARFHSALAVSVMLLCDLAPAMGLGAVVGAAADRWPRRRLLVAGDLLRVVAFVGLALTGSFPLMVALALTSGVGQALFHPTVMATLPSLVSSERLPVATGLYGALREAGFALGPVIAAVAFVVIGADGVLLANAATFALSAGLILTIPCGRAALDRKVSLRKALRDGRGALRAVPAARTVVLSSTAFVCFLGTVNVGELLLVRNTLGGTGTQYAIVVAVMGAGIVAGSLLAGRVSRPPIQAYLVGLGLCATGMAACAGARAPRGWGARRPSPPRWPPAGGRPRRSRPTSSASGCAPPAWRRAPARRSTRSRCPGWPRSASATAWRSSPRTCCCSAS